MAKQQIHKVWEVQIGNYGDKPVQSGKVRKGKRWYATYGARVQAIYLIEAKGNGERARKKALKLAKGDGIPEPYVKTIVWVNRPSLKYNN